jgi:hypothetical protein
MKTSLPGSAPPADNRSSGQMVVGAIAVLLIVAIFMPLVINFIRDESRWAVKQKRTTSAFHLAEAGIDRGVWKLTESEAAWNTAAAGAPIAGYNDDLEYTDVPGGVYKIHFSTTGLPGRVMVTAKGRDASDAEVRAVQAVFSKQIYDGATVLKNLGGITIITQVHWGPMVSFGNMDLPPLLVGYYPRKYAKGFISPRDADPAPPNTDGLEYWAYDSTLGDPPQVDLNYYKTLALASKVHTDSSAHGGQYGRIMKGAGTVQATASPVGSGYFSTSQNAGGLRFDKYTPPLLPVPSPLPNALTDHYRFRGSTSVIYIDHDAGGTYTTTMNPRSFLQTQALILAGGAHHLSYGANAFDNFMATVPINAQQEYQHPNAQTVWNNEFAGIGAGNCCYEIDGLGFHGFLYVGGDMNSQLAGTSKIVGSAYVGGNLNLGVGVSFLVYSDKSVVESVELQTSTPQRVSWREVKLPW